MRTIRDGNCTNSGKLTRNIKKKNYFFAINKAFCCIFSSFLLFYIYETNRVTFLIVSSKKKKIERNLNDLVVVPTNMLQYWHWFYCLKYAEINNITTNTGTFC